jgi:hypothetical protein
MNVIIALVMLVLFQPASVSAQFLMNDDSGNAWNSVNPRPAGGGGAGELQTPAPWANCRWEAFTPDQRSFAAQPGRVFPLKANDIVAGNYLVFVGPAGTNGLNLPPANVQTFGPYALKGGKKYKARIQINGRAILWEEETADLLPYESPCTPNLARVYVRNDCGGNEWYAICLMSAGGPEPWADCDWKSFTPDPRSFATQPGRVFPLPDVLAGNYLVFVGPAGTDGNCLPPAKANTFGPYNLSGGKKYKTRIQAGGQDISWEEETADMLPYESPGPGLARVYVRNDCGGTEWYAICLKLAGGGGGQAILPPSDPTSQDGTYSGTCAIGGIGTFPFNFQANRGFFSGRQDQTLYSLQWQGNYDKAGNILAGMITGWVDIGTGAQKIRWTVRGPIQGTITRAASRGNFSATAPDGNQTWTGSWTASAGAPTVQPCANYFGPIEPLRIAGAGPGQRPGTYWLVYADAPRSPDSPEKWAWKKYGPVTLKGGKRYFVVFGRGAEVQWNEESNLPPQETLVKSTPDTAIVWHENDSSNGARIAYCFQRAAGSEDESGGGDGKPVLHIDLSVLDSLRTNQTFTLTATAENIPASVSKLKFGWYLHTNTCLSSDPPGQKTNFWYDQIVTPANGKTTCSITVKASSSPQKAKLTLSVQDEPYKKIVFLSADKDYAIKQ